MSTTKDDPTCRLRALAQRLHGEGMDAHTIALELARLNCQLGQPVRAPIVFVRELPGLENYDVMKDWAERVRAYGDNPALIDGLDETELRACARAESVEESKHRQKREQFGTRMKDAYRSIVPEVEDTVRRVMVSDIPPLHRHLHKIEGR